MYVNHYGANAYKSNAIETATPEQLTLMCYDGALNFLRRAERACGERDIAKLGEWTGRAQAVVDELNVTLDMDAGGEIAQNLRAIYLFINRHLSQAVIHNDAKPIADSIKLLKELRDAWATAAKLDLQTAA